MPAKVAFSRMFAIHNKSAPHKCYICEQLNQLIEASSDELLADFEACLRARGPNRVRVAELKTALMALVMHLGVFEQ